VTKLASLLVSAFQLVSPAFTHADTPAQVRIQGVRATGGGCPAGSASAVIAPDGSAFSLLLNQYQAQSGGPGEKNQDRQQCQVQIDFDVEPGWQFAIVRADYRGFVDISKGALARHKVVYSFDGRRIDPNEGDEDDERGSDDGLRYGFATTVFRGPRTEDYLIQQNVRVARRPKSFCSKADGHRLYLSTFLITKAPGGARHPRTSLITLDSVDGQVQQQQFKLEWYRCSRR
jgi:hypothetical protein